MFVNRIEIKSAARASMAVQKPSVFFVTLIYMLIIVVVNMLSEVLLGGTEALNSAYNIVMNGGELNLWQFLNLSPYGIALVLALNVMTTVIGVGYSMYCLLTSRNQAANAGTLFDSFGMFFKILWLTILEYIYISLWTWLFIFPGIIAAYRYRQAMYILIDDPTKSASQCIRESKQMMKGHKTELFFLDLSLFGWMFLTSLPFVGVIASIWAHPYLETTYCNYYNVISGQGFGEYYGKSGGDGEDTERHGWYTPKDFPGYEQPKNDSDNDNRPPWEYK